EDRALRLQHRARDDVLGRDQLDLVPLAAEFAADRREQFRIGLLDARREEMIGSVTVPRDVAHRHDRLRSLRSARRAPASRYGRIAYRSPKMKRMASLRAPIRG